MPVQLKSDTAKQVIEDMWNLTMGEQEFKRRIGKLMHRAFMAGSTRNTNWEKFAEEENLNAQVGR